MENIKSEEVQAITDHMSAFVFAVQEALKDFIKPIDPTEGEEEMQYVRDVIEAVDNLVSTVLFVKDDPIAQAALKVSTDIVIAQLVEMHTKNETKH